jgi:predicted HTH domain antitoxin
MRTLDQVFTAATSKETALRQLRARLSELDAEAEKLRLKRMKLYDNIQLFAQGRISFEAATRCLSRIVR